MGPLTDKELAEIHLAEKTILEDKKRDSVSVSEIGTFLKCPLRHKFKYIYNINLEETSKSLLFGSFIHEPIAEYYKEIWKSGNQNVNILFAGLENVFKNNDAEIEKITKDSKEKHKFKTNGLACLEAFHKKMKGKYSSVPITYKPKYSTKETPAVELEIKIPIINIFSKQKEKISNCQLHGYIDLISQNEKHGLTIWDHKTAQRKWPQFQIKTDIQLAAYAYMFRYEAENGHFPDTINCTEDHCGYNFIFKTKEPQVSVNVVRIEKWRIQLLFDIIKQIEKAKEINLDYPTFNYDYYKACAGCPYHSTSVSKIFNSKKSICYQHLKGATKDNLLDLAQEIKEEK